MRIKNLTIKSILAIVLNWGCFNVYAATINVPTSYSTIQAAINTAQHGDTVLVAAGEYKEQLTMKSGIHLKGSGKDVTTITFPDSVVGGILIDCQNLDANTLISDFHIKGKVIEYGSAVTGIGINCENSYLTICNSKVSYHKAKGGGDRAFGIKIINGSSEIGQHNIKITVKDPDGLFDSQAWDAEVTESPSWIVLYSALSGINISQSPTGDEKVMYEIKDNVLNQSFLGRKLTKMMCAQAKELTELAINDPQIKQRLTSIMNRLVELGNSYFNGSFSSSKPAIDSKLNLEITNTLDKISKKASPGLKKDILIVKKVANILSVFAYPKAKAALEAQREKVK